MLRTYALWIVLAALLTACAHRGAVRVECEGPLRPINRPASPGEAPVSVTPAAPAADPRSEHP